MIGSLQELLQLPAKHNLRTLILLRICLFVQEFTPLFGKANLKTRVIESYNVKACMVAHKTGHQLGEIC